jgi:ElaB/YqjD/DUF883 family membrane-anchored ribosome-binding protein
MEANTEQMIREVRALIQEGEDLIRQTAGEAGEQTRQARAKLAGAMVVIRETCNRLEEQGVAKVRQTNRLERHRAYPVVGLAFALGVLVGVLVNRD